MIQSEAIAALRGDGYENEEIMEHCERARVAPLHHPPELLSDCVDLSALVANRGCVFRRNFPTEDVGAVLRVLQIRGDQLVLLLPAFGFRVRPRNDHRPGVLVRTRRTSLLLWAALFPTVVIVVFDSTAHRAPKYGVIDSIETMKTVRAEVGVQVRFVAPFVLSLGG